MKATFQIQFTIEAKDKLAISRNIQVILNEVNAVLDEEIVSDITLLNHTLVITDG